MVSKNWWSPSSLVRLLNRVFSLASNMSQYSSEQPKSRTELTQSYRRSNSEDEEKRPLIRESVLTTQLSAHGLMEASLWWCCADHILQAGPLQAHTVFCLLDCLQQRWLQAWRSVIPSVNQNTAPFLTYPSVSSPHCNRMENTHIRADQEK